MKFLKLKILVLAVFLLFVGFNQTSAQSTLQLKFAPIGVHPFTETNSHLFENRIDANGMFIVEPCFILSFENYIRSDTFSWRGMLGVLSDAASKPGIFLHLGFKQRLIQIYTNSISIGFGGALYGHDSWTTIPGYISNDGWSANGDWDYKVGLMAELEYALFLNDNNDITLSVMYGHQPNAFTFSIGYKYWLSSVIKHPKKCGTCPFQKTNKHWNP